MRRFAGFFLAMLLATGCGDSSETGSPTPPDSNEVSTDTAEPSDTVAPDTAEPADTAEPSDTVAPADVPAPPDTSPADTAVAETTAPVPSSCDLAGTWTLDLVAVPEKACGQNANQQVYIIEPQGDGSWAGTLPAMEYPVPIITVQPAASESGCAMVLTMTAIIVFPPDSNGVVDTVTAAYTFDVNALDGAITGTGTVHMTTVTDAGETKVDCQTPIAVTGQFAPTGD